MGDIAAKCTSSSSGGARRSPQTILLWRYDGDQMKCTHLYGACHALISRIAPVQPSSFCIYGEFQFLAIDLSFGLYLGLRGPADADLRSLSQPPPYEDAPALCQCASKTIKHIQPYFCRPPFLIRYLRFSLYLNDVIRHAIANIGARYAWVEGSFYFCVVYYLG